MTPHVELELLRAAETGEVPDRELRRYRRRHLDACCDRCDLHMTVFEGFVYAEITTDPAARARCYADVAAGSVDLATAFAADRTEVERDLAALRSVKASARLRKIRRAASPRFRSPLLVEALIGEGRRSLGHDAREAVGWLEVAREVVARAESEIDHSSAYAPLRDLRLRIQGHHANALRVLGELR